MANKLRITDRPFRQQRPGLPTHHIHLLCPCYYFFCPLCSSCLRCCRRVVCRALPLPSLLAIRLLQPPLTLLRLRPLIQPFRRSSPSLLRVLRHPRGRWSCGRARRAGRGCVLNTPQKRGAPGIQPCPRRRRTEGNCAMPAAGAGRAGRKGNCSGRKEDIVDALLERRRMYRRLR